MTKQKHDLGYRKRKAAPRTNRHPWTASALNRLAADLVRRGLASPQIVGSYKPTTRFNHGDHR